MPTAIEYKKERGDKVNEEKNAMGRFVTFLKSELRPRVVPTCNEKRFNVRRTDMSGKLDWTA